MQKSLELNTLQVALEANAAAYRRAVQTGAPGECWDFVVLTATNEKQAAGYRKELELRQRAVGPTSAFFPAIQKSLVVADPPGPRIGSGGATLNVMRELVRRYDLKPADFDRLRILLIHSGGMSQRLPMYSPVGKIFAPLPLLRPDGQIATLFDHLYLTLAGLPERLGPGMLILAGDVFLLFDHRNVRRPAPGVTALTMRVEAEVGRGHGVFVTDAKGRIAQTLQKVGVDEMKARGATDDRGCVLIDSGLLFFDASSTRTLCTLSGCPMKPRAARAKAPAGRAVPPLHEKHKASLDLYEEIAGALASGIDEKTFLGDPKSRPMRRELWRTLHGVDFRAMEVGGEFLHLGTTRQFRDAMVGDAQSPAAELFQQNVLAHSEWPLGARQRVYHSVLLGRDGAGGRLGEGAVVEHSILRAPSRIGRGSVVSQVVAADKPIELADERLLFQVPVRDKTGALSYVQVCCGVEDDFKGRYDDGECRFLNEPIDQWMQRYKVTAREIWGDTPKAKRTLWTARLYVGTPRRDAAQLAVRLADGRATKRDIDAWRKASRWSMAMILDAADPVALIEHRETVAAYLQSTELLESIKRREDRPVGAMVGRYSSTSAYAASEQVLESWASAPTNDANLVLDQARAMWSISQLLQRPDYPDPAAAHARVESFMRRAFERVATASEIGHQSIQVTYDRAGKLRPGVTIEAASPVRLDLDGGWSDTPPYCFERGGHVINVAINLNGRPPVRATVQTIAEPRIILESNDLGQTIELKRVEDRVDVHDPFALHKVALGLTGLVPTAGKGGSLSSFVKSLGAGFRITTECRVPKGSGLGTSSILAATLLAALHKLRGRDASTAELIEQTLLLEQRLSTGGGWQDQVGGIVGGVKSTVTGPGIPQRPVVEPLALSDTQYAELQERFVVYFSGQQRLARDILRRVMGRWLAREPSVLMLMETLKQSTAALRTALLKSQWRQAAEEIARYWAIKKDLFPGSTTPEVDVMMVELRDDYLAAGLAGAGGGGFAYFFCKDARQAARLRERLAERASRPGSMGSVFETEINRTGLVVKTT